MRFIASYFVYYLGDLACKIMELNDNSERWVNFWYPAYNKLMIRSVHIQGDENGPWEHK